MNLSEGLEAYLKSFSPDFSLDLELVCSLLKSLYGLKQSSRQWYQRIDQFLLLHGFIRLTCDANIYIQRDNSNGFLILTIYVDDCI